MDTYWLIKIALLFLFLVFSALFSGSEVAMFSFDEKKLKIVKEKHSFLGSYIENMIASPRRLLVTILLGNTIFNVAASILSVTMAIEFAQKIGLSINIALILQIVFLTVLILIFGEVTPKIWASKSPVQFAVLVAIPLYWISVLFYPISKTITDIINAETSRLKKDRKKTALLSSELSELADIGIEKGSIDEEEHELIHGFVSFRKILVREVMTPRVDITALSKETKFDDALKIITESGHSRLPLYEDNLDNIIGILYAKDLLKFIGNESENKVVELKKLVRTAYFVPETKLISDLMHEFQEKKIHMGIAVDEYGGTSGLVSLEDIIEEIVGEIRDEHDKEEMEIIKIDDNSYEVLGKIDLDELNEALATKLNSDTDEYDTLGGFIFNFAGTIPKKGFNFKKNGFKFTVTEVSNKRITKVLVQKINNET